MFRPVFLRCEKRLVWFFPVTKTWKEFSQYNLTLSSSEYFLFDGKRTKSISWHFTTADKQSLAEQVEDIPFDPLRPLQSLTPHEGDNFKIDYPEKGVFTIHLIGTFNAGVNGPPIEEQRKRYYQEIAQAKNNALSWMKSICQDPNKIKIKWEYSKF
jgi:hypothetical protein